MNQEDLSALQTALGHSFRNPEMLERALTHSSRAHEEARAAGLESATEKLDNEQFEFLGDAVLGLVTSELLFERFPEFHEGQLSKLKAHLVSAGHLVKVAAALDLGRYLRLGRGEERSGGRSKSTLLSDALEAVIAALYMDAGLERARDFIVGTMIEPELEEITRDSDLEFSLTDFKSSLQELVQSTGRLQPVYVTVKEEGPDHRKTFTVEARIFLPQPGLPQPGLPQHNSQATQHHSPEFVARATGATKKKAEQQAARQVLDYLKTHMAVGESQNA